VSPSWSCDVSTIRIFMVFPPKLPGSVGIT
jgi:hypothetical protein